MTVFISHSSRDAASVQTLVEHLTAAHETVWLDQELSGGQAWWDEILQQIRSCSVFLYAVSNNSRMSKPCRAELDYARALGLPILPVQIGDVESYRIDALFHMQMIDYRKPDAASSIALITAVRERAAERGPLPDPLPDPPPIPYEYLQRLGVKIDSSDPISPMEQSAILIELRQALTDEHDASVRDDIRQLMRALRERPDVTFTTASEIDRVLAESEPPAAASGSPTYQGERPTSWSSGPLAPQPLMSTPGVTQPIPQWVGGPPSPPNRGRWILLGAGAIVILAVVALVIWLAWPAPAPVHNTNPGPTTSNSSRTTTTSSPVNNAVTALRAALPKGYAPDACAEAEPLGDALATMKCGANTNAGGPQQGLYSIYANTDLLKTAFDKVLTLKDAQLVTCPHSEPSPTTWHHNSTPDVVAGNLACQNYKGMSLIVWTDNDRRLLGIANGDQLDALYGWWTKSG